MEINYGTIVEITDEVLKRYIIMSIDISNEDSLSIRVLCSREWRNCYFIVNKGNI